MSSIRKPANPMLDHNSLPFYPQTAASQVVRDNGTKLETDGVISVDHATSADNAKTATSATLATNAANAANAAKLGNQDPNHYYAGPHNYEYSGRDLSTIFASLADLHTAVAAGNFTNIRVGDYWPITLSATVHDYAADEDKTLNSLIKLEVAGINVYHRYGDTVETPQHLVMCSRDLLPWTLMYRNPETTWYDADQTNPWLGSHLYQTLNNSTNGVLAALNSTDFASYIYSGPNGNGMRFLGETKASGATSATGWAWIDRGKLFLPTEREVWGQDVWSEHSYGGGAGIQWPIFAGSMRHVIKGLGNGGGRNNWWVQSSYAGSASYFCVVSDSGHPYSSSASYTWVGAPLCFLFV